jgi:hypothetical protein
MVGGSNDDSRSNFLLCQQRKKDKRGNKINRSNPDNIEVERNLVLHRINIDNIMELNDHQRLYLLR